MRLGVVSIVWTASFLAWGCSSSEESGGGAGESCTARRDCASGLACIGLVCVDTGALAGRAPPSGQGASGESCRARNDCQAGLACISDVCIGSSVTLPSTTKSCVRVECTVTDDCCKSFVPSPNCSVYQQSCATDPTACYTYHSLCDCNKACTDSLCVDTPPACTANAECASLLTPFCASGACVECAQPGDCPGQNDQCLDGKCKPPCTIDDQCALLEACQNGSCVHVGCQSDRECAFMEGDSRATCVDTECQVPCSQDADCARRIGSGSFDICVDGKCQFVGCETDAECRAYLGVEDQTSSTVKAVCQ